MSGAGFQSGLIGLEVGPFHHLKTNRLRGGVVVRPLPRLVPSRLLAVGKVEGNRVIVGVAAVHPRIVGLSALPLVGLWCVMVAVQVGFDKGPLQIAGFVPHRQIFRSARPCRNAAAEQVLLKGGVGFQVFDNGVAGLPVAVNPPLSLNRLSRRGRQPQIHQHPLMLPRHVMQANTFLARIALHHQHLHVRPVGIKVAQGLRARLCADAAIE